MILALAVAAKSIRSVVCITGAILNLQKNTKDSSDMESKEQSFSFEIVIVNDGSNHDRPVEEKSLENLYSIKILLKCIRVNN